MFFLKNTKLYLSFITIISLSFFGGAHLAFSSSTATTPIQKIESHLIELKKNDQGIRQKLIEVGFDNLTESLRNELDSIDKKNTDSLKRIINDHGWPILSQINKEAKNAFLIIIQHSDKDPEFQQHALKFVKRAYEEGHIKGQDVALLTDQILLAEGKPQKYGTQFNVVNGEFIIFPLENESKVDFYRSELKLPKLEQYIDILKKYYAN
tara:strand:+ start:577 stop:1203 length:627 start_codon:yes stop_codon:yes gene_type:complete